MLEVINISILKNFLCFLNFAVYQSPLFPYVSVFVFPFVSLIVLLMHFGILLDYFPELVVRTSDRNFTLYISDEALFSMCITFYRLMVCFTPGR